MTQSKITKHQREMEILRAYHEKVIVDDNLRQEALVRSGLFVRRADGELEVSKSHESAFSTERAATQPAGEVLESAFKLALGTLALHDMAEAQRIGAIGREALAAPISEDTAKGFPERDQSKPAEQQGMFRKFDVRRTDGSSAPGGKHHGCRYWVLDLDHDAHAPAAMRAYADEVRSTHPLLAVDIDAEFPAARTPASVGNDRAAFEASRNHGHDYEQNEFGQYRNPFVEKEYALWSAAPERSGKAADDELQNAARYKALRRKVCIAGGKFHILNLDPTYIASHAEIELDAAIDAQILATKEKE